MGLAPVTMIPCLSSGDIDVRGKDVAMGDGLQGDDDKSSLPTFDDCFLVII